MKDLDRLVQTLLLLIIGPLLLVVLGLLSPWAGRVGAVALGVALLWSFRQYLTAREAELNLTRSAATPRSYSPQSPPNRRTTSDPAALNFALAVLRPDVVVDRVFERVEPLTRALRIQATHTITFESPDGAYYPALLQRKGSLIDSLVMWDASDEIPIFSQSRSADFALRSIDALVESYARYPDLYNAALRRDTFKLLAGSPNPDRYGAGGVVRDEVLQRLSDCLRNDRAYGAISALVKVLTLNYCHTVHIDTESSPQTVRTEYRVMQDLKEAGKSEGFRNKLLAVAVTLRIATGHRPMRWVHSVSLAARASSYHLQIMGPPGAYLSRQSLSGTDSAGAPVQLIEHGSGGHVAYSRFRARLGQRYLHLYLRDGSNALLRDRFAVFAGFFERPPGSVAVAAMASAASTALIISAGYIQTVGADPQGDIIAVLLAFPFVVGSISGLDASGGPLGGVMMARVGGLVTAGLSTVAAISILGYERIRWSNEIVLLGSSGSWALLTYASCVTTALLLGSWVNRSYLYYRFLKRDAAQDFIGTEYVDY